MSPMIRNTARALTAAALVVSLSGCISVFPKAKPASLYRFGEAEVSVPKGPPGAMFGARMTPGCGRFWAVGERRVWIRL